MSKSITITLPNDIADTLERRMQELALSTVPGVKNSKSAYVATAVKVQLIKEGCNIVADDKPAGRKRGAKRRVTPQTPVAGVSDFRLDEDLLEPATPTTPDITGQPVNRDTQ